MDREVLGKELKRWKIDREENTSRYSEDFRILYSDGVSQIETHDRMVITQDNTDKFYRVDMGTENRLDLVSWRYYNSPMYWWVIAVASNIEDPLNIPAGTLLRIPDLGRALREVKNE